MESKFICYNNKFYSESQAVFKLNRAMKFGDGLFETIRVVKGKLKYLDFHFQRLQQGLDLLQIEFSQLKWNEIRTCLTQLLIKNEVEEGGRVRLTAYRGGAGKYSPETNALDYFIEVEPLMEENYALNQKGLTVEIAQQRLFATPISHLKTISSISYVLIGLELTKRPFDDLILLNQHNRICETSSSNIFLIVGKTAITPKLSEGCLAGVMRRVVISKLISLGYIVEESEVATDKLQDADEIFLTNAINGIRWVGSYQNKRYFNKTSKLLLQQL
jgi:branched-chain amino acid aminotransferase